MASRLGGHPFHEQGVHALRRVREEVIKPIPLPTMPAEVAPVVDVLPSCTHFQPASIEGAVIYEMGLHHEFSDLEGPPGVVALDVEPVQAEHPGEGAHSPPHGSCHASQMDRHVKMHLMDDPE